MTFKASGRTLSRMGAGDINAELIHIPQKLMTTTKRDLGLGDTDKDLARNSLPLYLFVLHFPVFMLDFLSIPGWLFN